ncbi:MAG: ATP-binding protein [Nitriliruptorales bacterium]|nr:ATP-binding protein [Nitriliruptorales bacterium]
MEATARARGAAGYLVKGLSPHQLVEELLVLLDDLPERPVNAASPEALRQQGANDLARAQITLPASPASGRAARTFVSKQLAEWRLEGLRDTALLLTSELVTNAVVHARSPVNVTIRRVMDRLRVEVADVGGGALVLRDPDLDATGGRGLQLMEAMAVTWGTSAFVAGKLVWFELSA